MKLIWPPKKTSPKFAHRVTRIRMLMKMISARNARRRRTRHSNPQSAFRNPKFSWARQDSNLGPRDYESPALTAELQAPIAQKVKHSERRLTNQERRKANLQCSGRHENRRHHCDNIFFIGTNSSTTPAAS